MYILVNTKNVIVASSNRKPSEEMASANNQRVYELDDSEFNTEMIGSVLEDFILVEEN